MERTLNGHHPQADRPVAELLKQLSEQASTLVREEMELAKAELRRKGKAAGMGAGLLAGAALFGVFAMGAITACVIAALATAVPTWLAALIVAVVYLAVAGVLALRGRTKLREGTPPAPEQAIESVKEDVQWTKQRAQAARQS
jgi:uncharacterized membrane protein YqjE